MLKNRINRRRFLSISAMTAGCLLLDWKKVNAFAARMGPKEDYPTVVIGTGLGGLSCAMHLCKLGVPVTMVEQHSIPGGYATSFQRGEGKYTFEVSLEGTSMHHNSVERMFREFGIWDQLELVELPSIYRLVTPSLDITVPQKNPEAYVKLLTKHFPEEKNGIKGFVDTMIALCDEVDQLSRKHGKFFKLIFPLQYRRMWTIRHKTLADLLDEHVQNPDLKHALSSLWGYYGLPPSLLSGFYFANATGGYLKNGSYYIKHTSQALSDLLAQTIEASGGKILYDTQVKGLILKNNKIAGVKLADGTKLPARAVVSNASALTTLTQMVPERAISEEHLEKIKAYKPSISSFQVWLGLNQDIRSMVKDSNIHVALTRDHMAEYKACLAGDIEKMSFGIAVYDNACPGYSYPGTSTVKLICLSGYKPWEKFAADYQNGQKRAYHAQKQAWTEILIKKAEKIIPGLSSMIEVMDASTPLTNWRYTGNTQGAIYGFEQSMQNAFMNRIKNRTPIKGLYLAGAWGNPGGGYEGALIGGQFAFRKIIQDWGA